MSGSKLICQLPEPFRRLSRPSSPVIAKASTICTYSLDPITLKPEPFLNSNFVTHETSAIGFLKQLFLYSKVVEYKMVYFTYIYFKNFRPGNSCEQNVFRFCNQSILFHWKQYCPFGYIKSSQFVYPLYFFHFVKEQSS